MRAAGVILISTEGRVLLLRRSPAGDMPRRWCFPGGGIEDGESPEEAAIRELEEECDIRGDVDNLVFWTRTYNDQTDVEFTTFAVRGVMEFEPHLNNEHLAFMWADPENPPRPLHPGCEIALKRLHWDELDIARAMRDGELSGPQDYENIVLFALRITGTGVAFRHKWGEFVQRDPALYLNDDFLARCNGLPVIMEHPKTDVLTTEEFKDRAVGTIMLPYIKGDEVWGIAKIYDAQAADMMKDEQLSTSPAVVWRDPDVNTKLETEDGQTILVEGKPSLLDHLAVCRQGVWDKGGIPEGIDITGVLTMADDKKPKTAADASGGTTLDKLLKGLDAMSAKLDSVTNRMDAIDKKGNLRKDDDALPPDTETKVPPPPPPSDTEEGKPAPVAADAPPPPPPAPPGDGDGKDKLPPFLAKKDAEPPTDQPPPKALEAAADSTGDLNALRRKLAELEARMPKERSDHDLAADQARADSVYSMFGESAPRPLIGDTRTSYVLRNLEHFKKHSPAWAAIDLTPVSVDEKVLDIAAEQIYAAARTAAQNPANVPLGTLRAITTRSPTGHLETRFMGSPSAWMNRHAPNKRFVTAINLKKD